MAIFPFIAFKSHWKAMADTSSYDLKDSCLKGGRSAPGHRNRTKAPWPKLLGRQHRVLAVARLFQRWAQTVKSAQKQAERMGEEKGLVLLEIGGNDLLGTTSAADFDENLDHFAGGPMPAMGERC